MRSRMFLIPKMFSHWWETLERPHRLLDQHFAMGMNPEQFFKSAFDRRPMFYNPSYTSDYLRSWADFVRDEEHGWSMVKNDKNKFNIALDVQQFKPNEINVKVVDNVIVVEGKHEEKEDDHGVVSRHFVRKYMVPEQCDIEQASSTLSSDGVLTITAPRKAESVEAKNEKTLKIEQTGKPAQEEVEEEPVKIADRR